jgi:hypothetical protein
MAALGTGCESLGLSLSAFTEDRGPREHFLPGAPDKEALTLKSALEERGLRPEMTPGDDTTVIACRSGSGQAFRIILRRTIDGRTCARVSLDGRADDETKVLLAQLDLR